MTNLRLLAVAGPALLLGYGVLRLLDGGRGWAWDVGHVAFLSAVCSFTVLALRLRAGSPRRVPATAAAAATVVGAAAFTWVIMGDLFPSIQRVPAVVFALGPVLFQAGLVGLLVLLVVARRLPVWSPVAVLAGFAAIAVDLDLLPIGALLLFVGLMPVPAASATARAACPP